MIKLNKLRSRGLLLCLIFFLFCSINTLAQEVKWDSTSRSNVYDMLVKQFRAFPPDRNEIVLLGNSITFWGNWKERLKDCKIKNQGIPGDITYGVLDRINEAITNTPDEIFILIGINDISHHIPDSAIIKNFRRIIDKIQEGSPSTTIYLQSLLPTGASRFVHRKKDILKINAALKEITAEKKIRFINLFSHFVDVNGNLIEDYTWDGIHLTESGYDEWVRILKEGHYLK